MCTRTTAAAALIAVAAFASPAVMAQVEVVATLPELGALVEQLGGERVHVTSLVRGDEDPHFLAAKPSFSRHMRKADLLVYNGLQLEVGWLPLLLQGARNPAIRPGAKGNLDLSHFIDPLEVPLYPVDRRDGDIHPEGNPHYTVSPQSFSDIASVVTGQLMDIDREGGQYYLDRLSEFEQRWREAFAGWKKRLAILRGVKVIAYHKQWEYFAATFGIEIVDYIENKPGVPPTPRHIADLHERIESDDVRLILYSDLIHPRIPQRLANRSGVPALALPQSPGSREGTEDLFTWFETIVSSLESAAG